jgi:hypothetical protein
MKTKKYPKTNYNSDNSNNPYIKNILLNQCKINILNKLENIYYISFYYT